VKDLDVVAFGVFGGEGPPGTHIGDFAKDLNGLRFPLLVDRVGILDFITVQSLKTAEEDVFGSPLWVADPTFENYTELFERGEAQVRGYAILPKVPFVVWLANSAVVLAASVALTLACAVLAAYALGRLQPPGWRWWRRGLFATYVIPHTILFIPIYQVLLSLGLDDSRGALVLVYSTMALPFCIWLLSAYYRHLPPEIEESALVEGASRLTAFVRIMLPMSRNVLVAAGLFTLGTVGQDFMLASIFLLDRHQQTVAAGLGVMETVAPRGDGAAARARRWPSNFGLTALNVVVQVARRALAPSRDLVQIVPTRFGAESGMLGAAVLALDGVAAAEAT